jgi:hypothetical protein
MRLAIIELGKDETVFYNLGIFNEEERIIIFPEAEFLRLYEEITYYLELMEKVLENALGPEPEFESKLDFETLEVTLKKIKNQIEPLLDFDVQTTLEAYQNQEKGYEKTRRIKNHSLTEKTFPA